jgi:hypothetical protein
VNTTFQLRSSDLLQHLTGKGAVLWRCRFTTDHQQAKGFRQMRQRLHQRVDPFAPRDQPKIGDQRHLRRDTQTRTPRMALIRGRWRYDHIRADRDGCQHMMSPPRAPAPQQRRVNLVRCNCGIGINQEPSCDPIADRTSLRKQIGGQQIMRRRHNARAIRP